MHDFAEKRQTMRWTGRQRDLLIFLVKIAGLSSRAIHRSGIFPDRSLSAISGEMFHLGLGDPIVQERIKNAKSKVRSRKIS